MTRARRVTQDDIEALLPIVQAYWEFEGVGGFQIEAVAAALGELLADPDLGAGWVLMENGTLAGYLLGVYVFSLEHQGLTAEIDEFFVLPQFRGLGAGTSLLEVAELEFARRGCKHVCLHLAKSNEGAREFYSRHGYAARSRFEVLEKALIRAT